MDNRPSLLCVTAPTHLTALTLSLPRVLSSKLRGKILNSILQNCLKQTAPLERTSLNSFHLNGHTLGFHPQTQTFTQPHLLTRGLTLGVKGLTLTCALVTPLIGVVNRLWVQLETVDLRIVKTTLNQSLLLSFHPVSLLYWFADVISKSLITKCI